MNNTVIEIKGLTRRFGKTMALDGVDLSVHQGTVLGLVGENGAGKTTLIKHILGLLKAQTGSVRVFGLDPVQDPPGVLSRTGYLSENREMTEWMRIGEYLRYTQAFYPNWDPAYAQELLDIFALDDQQKIKHLSRGQRAKVGLLAALAYRPALLLFDEPSSGLDPVVRRDILAAIVRTITDEGRTIVLSSHLLDEVERVAESIVMIHAGRVVLSDTLDHIREEHHQFVVRFDEAQSHPPQLPGLLSCAGGPLEWSCMCRQELSLLKQTIAELKGRIMDCSTPCLDEIFIARVKTGAMH